MSHRVVMGIALITLAVSYSAAYDLHQHTWRDRLLFLITPSRDNPDLIVQQRRIEQRNDALSDRDIRVFQLFSCQGYVGKQVLPSSTVKQLREHLGVVEEDHLLILIGKDGGIKRRTSLDTNLREIFQQIDAMPMRREEMRAKKEADVKFTAP